MSVIQIGNGCNEAETATVTGAVPAAFKAIKAPESVSVSGSITDDKLAEAGPLLQ